MKNIITVVLLLFLTGCLSQNNAPVETPMDVSALQTSAVNTAWASLNQTATANAPTNTPQPTKTPIPTNTSTPEPEPLVFTGNGNAVIEVNKWKGVAIASASYTGNDNFIVRNYDSNNTELGLVFNGLYDYKGTRLLDVRDNETTARLQVNTTGDWQIEIKPLKMATFVQPPFSYQGRDDDVLIVNGSPDLINYQASDSNFIIYAYTDRGTVDLVVNDIGPVTGSSILPSDTILLEINGDGTWSIDVTAK